MTDAFAMDRIEIQRKLYDARNEYLKAKKSVEFWTREISFLKECEDNLNKGRTDGWLFREMFGDTPLAEEVYGG
jgi:hypothetical protein